MIGYDNACKLRARANAKSRAFCPLTELFAAVRMVLDNFHRDNHTWCLERMPEIDPQTEENQELLAGRNTEACEQLNSWITNRTASSLAMGRGHFFVYWAAQFADHNDWIEEIAAARRHRFAMGARKQDPDQARQSKK